MRFLVSELRSSRFVFHHSDCQPVISFDFVTGRAVPIAELASPIKD